MIWAIREGDWNLRHDKRTPPKLYDLSKDFAEKTNLAAKFPDRVNDNLRL